VARLSGEVLVSEGPTAAIHGRVNAIHRDPADDLWIGSVHDLYRIHGASITHFTHADGLGSDYVQVIREGRNGTLWVGTAAGLFVHAGGASAPLAASQGLDSQSITAL